MATTPLTYEANKTTAALIDELSENQAQVALNMLLATGKLAENEIRSIVVHARTWVERE